MLAFAPLSGVSIAATTVLDHLASALHPLGGTAAAIVALTVLVRLALHPLTRRAVRGERARLRLAPQVAQLRRKHADDPARFAAELSALHRDAGVPMYAGLLPTLAQAPVFLVLYRVAAHLHGPGHALFGVDLATRLVTAAAAQWWLFGVLLAIAALVAWLSSRRAMRIATAQPDAAPTGLTGLLVRWAPYLSVLSVAYVPLAAGLYLLTSATVTLVENTVLRRGLPE